MGESEHHANRPMPGIAYASRQAARPAIRKGVALHAVEKAEQRQSFHVKMSPAVFPATENYPETLKYVSQREASLCSCTPLPLNGIYIFQTCTGAR